MRRAHAIRACLSAIRVSVGAAKSRGYSVLLRSPLGPTLLAAVRVLGGLLLRLRAVARPLSRVGAVVGGACANAFRRRLIVVLGGSLEEGAKGL